MTGGTTGPDDPERALRDVRERFIAAFPGQCDSIASLLASGDRAQIDGARRIVHRLTGLAGTVGFPTISIRAAELEGLLVSDAVDPARAGPLLSGIREAFAADVMTPPEWADVPAHEGRTVLVVEDDADQLAWLDVQLQRAGHRTVCVSRGDEAVEAARASRPSIVLLDVELPGMNGHAVCRALKTDPDLAGIPVVFLTTKTSIDSRLSGLTLGADDYLCKPVDARELLLRVARLTREATRPASTTGALTFDAFAAVVESVLAAGPAALVILRTAPDQRARLAEVLADESRRRDVVGNYDEAHLVWLLPGMNGMSAMSPVRSAVERARDAGVQAAAGVAAGAGGSHISALMAQADEALTDAWHRREPAVLWTG